MSEQNTEAPAGTGTEQKENAHPYGTERIPIVSDEGDTGGTLYMGAVVEQYEEARRFDGRNMVSLATGDQWVHEELDRTRRGRYYIVRSSQWQGSRTTARAVGIEEAAQWIVRNEYSPSQCNDQELAAKVEALLDQ